MELRLLPILFLPQLCLFLPPLLLLGDLLLCWNIQDIEREGESVSDNLNNIIFVLLPYTVKQKTVITKHLQRTQDVSKIKY